MSWNKLANTRQLSEAAIGWVRNGGRYCLAPPGSRDYKDFWDAQEDRCANGFRCGDIWIPGRHYFYLNFTPILKVPDEQLLKVMAERRDKRGKLGKITMEKVLEFPRFYEIDYEWYRYKHIAWHGGKFRGVSSPGARHIGCAKTRGAGFSYKEASDGVYNYTFIPESKSYYFASNEGYLITDGILNKVEGMMDFINDNIWDWKQNRMKKSTLMNQTASYVDEFGATRGSKSQIIGVIVDNPNKTRGKRGRKIVFEEGGSFKRLKEALAISKGSISDGGIVVGQISVFGTGGEEGPSIEGLEEIFNQPDVYDMLEFPNIWEEGFEGTTCGYFVPAVKTNVIFMDTDGNVDVPAAVEYEAAMRAKLEKAKDPKELDRYKAEYPIVPSEVFQRMMRNPFNIGEIDKQIRRVSTSAAIKALLRYGYLTRKTQEEGGGIEFTIQTRDKARPIETYPHDQKEGKDGGAGLEGCVTVVERPWLDQKAHTPEGIYQIVFDPFYKEESEDLTSLFACYVCKQYNNLTTVNEGIPIAWYVGRPKDINKAYDIMFMLAEWYNAQVQGEIAGGGQGVLDYAKRNRLLHKLDYELEMTDNKEITEKKNRSYLMNMSTEKKRMGLTYLVNWHMDQRGLNEEGLPIYTLHRIYDLAFLQELRKFGTRNADRVSAMIIWMFSMREKINRVIHQQEHTEGFYNRTLFGAGEEEQEQSITLYD